MLKKILNELQWTPYGIACPDAETAHTVHKFLREAVLDRHIYLSKIIGFAVKSSTHFSVYSGTYIARHVQLGESYPELTVKLSDKIFLNTDADYLNMHLEAGMNTCIKNSFGDLRDYKAEVLYTNPEVCRCLVDETVFCVRLQYDNGYRSMAENSKILDKEFFPCNTDYSLADYVRVLPIQPGDTLVPIRYYNGCTMANFQDILSKWYIYLQTGNIKSEEKEWVSNFVH